MNRRSQYWFLYPLVGPVLGLLFVSLVGSLSGGFRIANLRYFFIPLMNGEFYLAAYLLGGIPALFVGICDGVYAGNFEKVPIWVPVIAALFSFVIFFVVSGGVQIVSSKANPFNTFLVNPLLFTYLFAAAAVWCLIKLIYRPILND